MKPKRKIIFLMFFLSPLLSFVFIRPEWLARLVASTIFGTVASGCVLFLALHPTLIFVSKNEKGSGYWSKQRSESERQIAILVTRALIAAIGLSLLYVWTMPAIYDSFQVCRQGDSYLKQIRGRVVSNSSPAGMYFLHQGLSVEIKKGEPDQNCNAIFLPRHADLGKTYSFLIAPSSSEVLDFKSVPEDNYK